MDPINDYPEIIAQIRKLSSVQPPENLVPHIMQKIKKAKPETLSLSGRIRLSLKNRLNAEWLFSGQKMSSGQCALLLFSVGFFYLVAGLVAIGGLYDALSSADVGLWLKIQPAITFCSAFMMMVLSFFVQYRPKTLSQVQSATILHIFLILGNAFILAMVLSIPLALIFVLILTIVSVGLELILIGAIGQALQYDLTYEGKNCAQTN